MSSVERGVKSSTTVVPGSAHGSSVPLTESRAPRRRKGPLPWHDELYHEPLVGADLGTADEDRLLAVATRSADWYQRVTGVSWTPAGRTFFLGRLTGILRHWSEPSGHGLHRGWHLSSQPVSPAPWTSRREREICWPATDPRPVCRRQGDAVTRLVLGTPTCPGYFDLTRYGLAGVDGRLPLRAVQSWGTAVYLCDPVASTTATNARYQKVRATVTRNYATNALATDWDLDHGHVQELLLSA